MVLSESAANYIQRLDEQVAAMPPSETANRLSSSLRRMKMPSAPKVKMPKKLKDMKMPSAPNMKSVKNLRKDIMSDIKMPSAPKVKVPKIIREATMNLPSASSNKEAVSSYLAKRKAKKDEKKRAKSLLLLQMELQKEKKQLQQERLLEQQQQSYYILDLPPCRQLQYPPSIERQYEDDFFNDMVTLPSPVSAPTNDEEPEEAKEQEHHQQELEQICYQQEQALQPIPKFVVWREDEESPSDEEGEETSYYDGGDETEEMKHGGEEEDTTKHIRWQDFDQPQHQVFHTTILIQPASVHDVDLQQQEHKDQPKWTLQPETTSSCTNSFFQARFEHIDFSKTFCESTMMDCQPILQNLNETLVQQTNYKKTTGSTENKEEEEKLCSPQDDSIIMHDNTAAVKTLVDDSCAVQQQEQFICGIDPDVVQKSMEHEKEEVMSLSLPPPVTPNNKTGQPRVVRFAKMATTAGTPDTAPLVDEDDETPIASGPSNQQKTFRRRRRNHPGASSRLEHLIGDLSCGLILPSDIYSEFCYDSTTNNDDNKADGVAVASDQQQPSHPKKQQQGKVDLNHAVRQILFMST